jgi:diguanylate cyclase (GGDEF)-like protein/PAS domain S-box-containing protein
MAVRTNAITTKQGAHEKLRTSEIRYRRLFETAQDGILILDAATRKITEANPFMVELLAYSRDELLGQELWEIGLLRDVKASRQAFRELKERNYIRYENLPLQTKDGQQREVEFVSNVYLEDGHEVIQCNIRDITARTNVEQRLRKANEELTALVAELRGRDAEMLSLNRLHELLQACTSQNEAYQVISLVVSELFSAQDGCLAILRASDGYLEPVASWGREAVVEPVFSLEDCWALRRDQLHEVTDPQAGLLCRHFVHQPRASYLCVPLTVQGETLGVLCVLGNEAGSGEHQAGQQRLAVAVGEAIKMSLSNLKLQEKLREQAIRDPLTGLLNRRFLEETLSRDVYRAQRRDSPLCVVMLDLDDFKRFNDTFGHHAGDEFLREFGKAMRGTLRKSDISCRYGGDEFVLVLPDSSLPEARKRIEHICAIVKEIQSRHGEPGNGTMTVSAGIAQAGVHASDPGELLRAADKALYAAKAAGRDRVAVYQAKES